MPQVPRKEKLNMLLRDELGKIIDREVEFPDGSLVTITHAHASSDLRYATIFLSVMNADPQSVLKILEKSIYSIQQQLNRKLSMRPVPRIRFAIDEEEVRRETVEYSLARLKQKGEL